MFSKDNNICRLINLLLLMFDIHDVLKLRKRQKMNNLISDYYNVYVSIITVLIGTYLNQIIYY